MGVRDERDETVAVLGDVLGWELTASGWDRVGHALSGLAGSPDPAADLGYLELAGPFRISTRVGDEPVVPIPAPLRERVNELIHALTAREVDHADAEGTGGHG